jgi:hypothetical protein
MNEIHISWLQDSIQRASESAKILKKAQAFVVSISGYNLVSTVLIQLLLVITLKCTVVVTF